jgi:hypothetical protein
MDNDLSAEGSKWMRKKIEQSAREAAESGFGWIRSVGAQEIKRDPCLWQQLVEEVKRE